MVDRAKIGFTFAIDVRVRSLVFILLMTSFVEASANQDGCHLLVEPFMVDARTSPFYQYTLEPRDGVFESGHQNGTILREFFSPHANDWTKWLAWIQSDRLGPSPDGMPDFYYTSQGIDVCRRQEYPIDTGHYCADGSGGNRLITLLGLPIEHIRDIRGSSEQAKIGQQVLLDKLNMQLFGVYYARQVPWLEKWVLGVHWHPGLVAARTFRQPFRVSPYSSSLSGRLVGHDETHVEGYRVRKANGELDLEVIGDALDAREKRLAQERGDAGEDLKEAVDVVYSDEKVVLIKVPLGKERPPKNRNQEVIRQMFFITYWQMVQKSYRETGLFSNTLETAMLLLDDFIKTMNESSDDQNLYLMYEQAMWQRMVFRMSIANHYVQVKLSGGAGWQPYQYQSIPDVFWPFYPLFGLTSEKYPTGEVELKRLFENRDPDPLNILGSLEPFERPKDLNKLFFYEVASNLKTETEWFVAVSITRAHTALYKRMGFELVKREFHHDWGTEKWTLLQSVEHYLSAPTNRYSP